MIQNTNLLLEVEAVSFRKLTTIVTLHHPYKGRWYESNDDELSYYLDRYLVVYVYLGKSHQTKTIRYRGCCHVRQTLHHFHLSWQLNYEF